MNWLIELRQFAANECNGWVTAYPDGDECRLEAKSLKTGLTLSFELNESQAQALGELAFNASYRTYEKYGEEDDEEYEAQAHVVGSWEEMLELVHAGEVIPHYGQITLSGYFGPVDRNYSYTGTCADKTQ